MFKTDSNEFVRGVNSNKADKTAKNLSKSKKLRNEK